MEDCGKYWTIFPKIRINYDLLGQNQGHLEKLFKFLDTQKKIKAEFVASSDVVVYSAPNIVRKKMNTNDDQKEQKTKKTRAL